MMKIRLFLALILGMLCFASCDNSELDPVTEVNQVQSDSTEEEEESTTSGDDS